VARGAWVSHLAVLEATRVPESVYQRDPVAIATAVDMLLNHERLTVQDAEILAAAVTPFRRHPRVGFPDCLMVERAQGWTHATWHLRPRPPQA
jgi:predicted nucleic-acid-binding protein